jgi:putative (di)nucleoside polyphosphate hydrolase
MMVIDEQGFRRGIGIILVNDVRRLFFARRINPRNAWQFPQGGMLPGETPIQAMYRELHEEVGLFPEDVELLAETVEYHSYNLPQHLIRQHSQPVCVGQMQKWFLLRLTVKESCISFTESQRPEFNSFRWVSYWYPLKQVVGFKRNMYREVLREFSPVLFPKTEERDFFA